MKAMRLNRLGEDEPFELFDKPDADPGPGEVAIRVHAASVNVVDTKIRTGPGEIAPEDPIVLGCDVAGVVTATGPGVTRFTVGDEVYGCAGGVKGRDGAYSERMLADERLLGKKAASLSFREAAALPLVTITAWEALVDRAQVQPGETVLVHGGTCGVGHIGEQIAKFMGAIVHTTVGTPENAEIAKSLGADKTILYRQFVDKAEEKPVPVRENMIDTGGQVIPVESVGAVAGEVLGPGKVRGRAVGGRPIGGQCCGDRVQPRGRYDVAGEDIPDRFACDSLRRGWVVNRDHSASTVEGL